MSESHEQHAAGGFAVMPASGDCLSTLTIANFPALIEALGEVAQHRAESARLDALPQRLRQELADETAQLNAHEKARGQDAINDAINELLDGREAGPLDGGNQQAIDRLNRRIAAKQAALGEIRARRGSHDAALHQVAGDLYAAIRLVEAAAQKAVMAELAPTVDALARLLPKLWAIKSAGLLHGIDLSTFAIPGFGTPTEMVLTGDRLWIGASSVSLRDG